MGRVAVAIPPWFIEQMKRLAGLKFAPADLSTHWEALSDVPPAVLEAAVTRAQKTRGEFPSPVELRQDADQVKAHAQPVASPEDRSTPLAQPFTITVPGAGTVLSVQREWNYYCEDCSDSGWRSVWCGDRFVGEDKARREIAKPWHESRQCERRRQHLPHEWVTPCSCVEWNPELKRKRDTQQKYAEQAAKK